MNVILFFFIICGLFFNIQQKIYGNEEDPYYHYMLKSFSPFETNVIQDRLELLQNIMLAIKKGKVLQRQEIESLLCKEFTSLLNDNKIGAFDERTQKLVDDVFRHLYGCYDAMFQYFGHSRFECFIKNCRAIVDDPSVNNNLKRILVRMLINVEYIKKLCCPSEQMVKDVSSYIPDQQFSFLWRSENSDLQKKLSTSSDVTEVHDSTRSFPETESSLSIERKNDRFSYTFRFNRENIDGERHLHYSTQLCYAKGMLCVTFELQHMPVELLEQLMKAIQYVNKNYCVKVLRLTHGNFTKFQILYPFVKKVFETQSSLEPVYVMFSTTYENDEQIRSLASWQDLWNRSMPVLAVQQQMPLFQEQSLDLRQRIKCDFSQEHMEAIESILKASTVNGKQVKIY